MELLQKYSFTIRYQPRKENAVANALSRRSLAATISLLQTAITDLIHHSSSRDPFYNHIVTTILLADKSKKDLCIIDSFCLVKGLLYYKNRVYISTDKELKLNILAKAHDVPIAAAHLGYIKTYNAL